jgi:hypothetical protein
MIKVFNWDLAVDVDQTLILWDHPGRPPNMEINGVKCRYNASVIRAMQEYKARGQVVCVWSATGQAWAQEVVELLGIEDLVDMTASKPRWAIDDKLPTEWLETYYVKDFTC